MRKREARPRSLIAQTIVKKLPKATLKRIKDAVLEKWPLLKLLGESEQLMLQLTSASSSPGAQGMPLVPVARAPHRWALRRTTATCNHIPPSSRERMSKHDRFWRRRVPLFWMP